MNETSIHRQSAVRRQRQRRETGQTEFAVVHLAGGGCARRAAVFWAVLSQRLVDARIHRRRVHCRPRRFHRAADCRPGSRRFMFWTTRLVHSNDLLVEIDPADYAIDRRAKTAAARSRRRRVTKPRVAGYELMQRESDDRRGHRASSHRPTPTPPPPPPRTREADFERSQDLRETKHDFRSRNLTPRKAAATKRRRI